jgi:hypothetical protein
MRNDFLAAPRGKAGGSKRCRQADISHWQS